jgi:hypothetical protein
MKSLFIIEKPKKCIIEEIQIRPISTRYFKKDNEPEYKAIIHEKINDGKVYMIKPLNGDAGDIYIGQTKLDSITDRLKYHISDYNYWKQGKQCFVSSFNLFEKYGVEECHIYLLENVCCDEPMKLKEREDYYLSKYNCVNVNKPIQRKKYTHTCKKPRSEAQIEAFKKVMEKRAQINKARLEEKKERELVYQKYKNEKNI